MEEKQVAEPQKAKMIPYLILVVSIIVLDQITKWVAFDKISYLARHNVIPGFFDFTLVYNPGAAFSFLADAGGWQKYFFLALAVVICTYLLNSIRKEAFAFWGNMGASMIVGGAIGNVVDRLIHGHVIDFLLFYYENWYYPAFNLADSAICVGAILILLDAFLSPKKTVNI